MNRKRYRLIFSTALGMMVPVAEIAKRSGKTTRRKVASGSALVLAGMLQAAPGWAVPVACSLSNTCASGSITALSAAGNVALYGNAERTFIDQVGNTALANFASMNIRAGHTVQVGQVDKLGQGGSYVPGAKFSFVGRIWDANPSVIAGSITQAPGQQANVTLINTNGIAFMGGSQVNLNSFTASTLELDDKYIFGSLLTNDSNPQFEGSTGFIKVFEGARITAGSQGRVMLLAPTVVNKGTVAAPDGQVILAAGTKVFLRAAGSNDNVRGLLVEVDSPDGLTLDTANTTVKNGVLDDQTVKLVDASVDKVGHATNLGELTTPRGNVTMIGYAVNQNGIARATTSVVANGSVYLLAKDEAVSKTEATRGGQVILGAGSLTEVLPDRADKTGSLDGETGQGLAKRSQVQVVGQTIYMNSGATILAPSGDVNLAALDNPGRLDTSTDPFNSVGAPVSSQAKVHISSGAEINVAGLQKVQVSTARNEVEVEFFGDQLKDSPVNRNGPLRGQKAYLDVNRALARANAGESTLISKDSLISYQAKLERTVSERSTTGGTVTVKSQGKAILDRGATIDLSGGSVEYTPATMKKTILYSGGTLIDLADANAETRFDGIATRYVIDYGRWNRKEVIDLGQSFTYDSGYIEGKNAGAMNVIGMQAVQLQATVQGKTVTTTLQNGTGVQPKGATLKLGSNSVTNDYKLNQKVVIGGTTLEDVHTLALDAALFGKDRVANFEVFSNQAAEVREAMRLPQEGSVAITAKGVTVNADVEASGGTIKFNARGNGVDLVTVPLDVTVADGVTLSARGSWTNDLPISQRSGGAAPVNGGVVALSATENVSLGAGSVIDVSGGGHLKSDGKLKNGNGGNVTLEAGAGASTAGTHTASVRLRGDVRGHALGKGGSLSINTAKIQIGGDEDPAALNLDPGFVARGGFSNINLNGRDGLTVAEGVNLSPRVESLELQPGYTLLPTGSRIDSVVRKNIREDRLRQAANLTLSADGTDFGVVKISSGARINGDDLANLAFKAGKRIEIQGQVKTAGGNISADLSGDFSRDFDATNTIWLGSQASLDASGAARTYVDSNGKQVGKVLNGGTIALNAVSGFVVTETGSSMQTNGVVPVRLDVTNEAGELGRMAGSDAGTIRIAAREGALLDGSVKAQAGSSTERGGRFEFALGNEISPQQGTVYPTEPRIISLAPTVSPQVNQLSPGAAVPSGVNGQAKLGAKALEDAGFEHIALKSRDTIKLENNVDLGGARGTPLREIQINAPRVETAGGNAALTAHTIRLGNDNAERQDAGGAPTPGTGVFQANAQLLELKGNQTFSGMARAELTGAQEVRLAGVSTSTTPRPSGAIRAAADLAIHGALIAPATYVQYTLDAPGRSIEFGRTSQVPWQPLSALGSLTVQAKDITQGGNLWAPLGQINLEATNKLVFKDGSLTSVAASPTGLVPFGKVENGRDWIVNINGVKVAIEEVPQKVIRTKAPSIDMQSGAQVSLAGGGDLQAYEFTVGPGGSRDILADANTYAILPGYSSGFAPSDVQEGFNRASGEAVYLSGVPGLKNGVYTLLPAHYALLPGAYAVKLDNSGKEVLPHQAYGRQDGVRIAAGYVTDTRAGAPRDARWQGIQVMTHEQVRARSEFTLTRASEFFADSRNRPQDAGLLSINATGSGHNALKLDAIYNLAAAPGGRGGQVDISAQKLAVTSGTPAGIDPDAVVLDADRLNALGADSLLIGGTRSASADTTTLTVDAETVTLANDAAHTLKAPEIMLAAKDTLTLKAGSAIDAQGEAGDAGAYETAGNGAFVRAASTSAGFSRTGSPDRTKGTLIGEPGSQITAADSITLDATKKNAYKGTLVFAKNGCSVAGNLGVGAERINFGAAPITADGITYSQAELDAFSGLKSLALSSYTTFDLYGGVKVGGLDANGKPTLQNLTLQGAGLAGIANADQTAQLNAQNLTLSNPGKPQTYSADGTGKLAVTANTLTLGKGEKAIKGYGEVAITANELVGSGKGTLTVDAPVTLNVTRISGQRGADQAFNSTGRFTVAQHTADHALAPINALGAKWALQGTSVDFDSLVELPSGSFKLTATTGHIDLGANARVDVAGRNVAFFDVTKPSWGGTAEFVSNAGDVNFNTGAEVDVSAAAGGDGGTLIVRATNGKFNVAQGSIQGQAPTDTAGQRGEGARALIDVKELPSFSTLNTALNSGGFDGERDLRVRTGNVNVAASDTTKALNIRIAADGGKLDVAGKLDASGEDAGRIELFAKNDVTIMASASLNAVSSGAKEDGGDIEIGSSEGYVNLPASDSNKGFNVKGGVGGQGGTVLLRAERTANDVKIGSLASSGLGSARSVSVEAVKVYSNINTLTATGASSGTTLSLSTINADNTAFAGNHANIKSRLGKTGDTNFHILSGVEVRSTGDLTLGTGAASTDWNLSTARAAGEAGVLTLRADGNLNINSNLSDGFNVATPSSGTVPATLLADESWSYRLVAGADKEAANPLAVKPGTKDFTLAAGKLIRTGIGDIRIASGNDIKLGDNKAVIYSAGRVASAVSGFTNPTNAQFSQGGGEVNLAALGNITGAASAQLYSNWLFRQGRLDSNGTAYETNLQPAWWVRFDQFQQGVAALGGGDVSIQAGGQLKNLSASTPTQARMTSTTPDAANLVKTGGGDVHITTGGDIEGGQYYADNGELVIRSGGQVTSGQSINGKPLYTILALGDAEAKVQARNDINLHAIINPHLVVQSSGAGANVNVNNATSPLWSVFSTYGENSGASVSSLSGAMNFHNAPGGSGTLASMISSTGAYKTPLNFAISTTNYSAARAFAVLPSSLDMTAFQGDILLGGSGIMRPAARGNISLLAANSVSLPAVLNMSDMAPMPDAVRPAGNTNAFSSTTLTAHATQPVHIGDTEPVRVYALAGDVTGAPNKLSLNVPKAVRVKAGRDVRDLGLSVQHVNATDISQVEAGRDVIFSSLGSRSNNAYIWVAGPGRLEVTAGRNVDLGTSAGIVSRGNLDNVALPSRGADIQVTAGVGPGGVDYSGAVDRLLAALQVGSPDDSTLWLARWLTGDESLTAANAKSAVQSVVALDAEAKRTRVRELIYTALLTTGRDSLNKASAYAKDYARGYAALEMVFPGVSKKDANGSFQSYQGEINLFASRILTERGGNIEFMTPGGDVIVGLSNTPAVLLATQVPGSGIGLTDSGVLGMATIADGNIRGLARDDILVNQSRILTVGGGDILLWSSEGDIDAGKGKKTAATVPPPLTLVDAQGNVTQVLQGAASGSGIGALKTAGNKAGDVYLIAPKGTVNAGDAGITADKVFLVGECLNCDNIVADVKVGTPVADTSAVTAASSGASNAGDVSSTTAALSQNLSDAARAAEELKQAFKPTFISAEVIGHGE